MKRLSTIIVTYKSDVHLAQCLDTLLERNDIGSALEIVVVDNEMEGACQRKCNFLDKYPSALKYIVNSQNGGYGQGNNIGIRAADAPVVLIMNPDVRLDGTTPARICERFAQDSRLLLLGMQQRMGNGRKGRSLLWAGLLPPGFVAKALLWACNASGLYFSKWQCVQGSCFAVRKAPFEKIGLFDERIFMYGEERDIHSRLIKSDLGYMAVDWGMSYRHLTDERTLNLATSMKQWQVAVAQCKRNGIPASIYWKRLKRSIELNLFWNRLKTFGRETASIRGIRSQLVAIETQLGEATRNEGKGGPS
ncbi:MAG: glycosyltransferase [Kiritimatiellae bacterium]|nr:glycosyltransferase [Kiritimatiellia bacterium]